MAAKRRAQKARKAPKKVVARFKMKKLRGGVSAGTNPGASFTGLELKSPATIKSGSGS